MRLITSLLLSARERRIIRHSPCNAGPRKEELQVVLPVDSRQLRNVKEELLQLTKKETADIQLWQKVGRTEEQNNSLLTVMAQRGQKRRAEETEEQRNRGLSHVAQRGQERRAEETEEQRNSRLSDMTQSGQERRVEENRRTKE
ncbi:hypothetical protein AVEN_9202-1 [Araneus ventricosus]|uniref:STPR domain-containing protein n=1 Tax=Araneus ventricosus TaxID=182803 RepID=A0A4Y2JSR9_ARAVE|nr:hypothetical protein AVEN_9202-1 [Araneus ventricosus]